MTWVEKVSGNDDDVDVVVSSQLVIVAVNAEVEKEAGNNIHVGNDDYVLNKLMLMLLCIL